MSAESVIAARSAPVYMVSPWLDNLRKSAIEQFDSTGFPKSDQEAWRFTNLSPITKTRFVEALAEADETATQLADKSRFGTEAAAELVFINGSLHLESSRLESSRLGRLPGGATVSTLHQAIKSDNGRVPSHLGQLADIKANPFVAMNTGNFRDAAVIYIPRGVTIESPIHLIFISTAGLQPQVSHPRVLVIAEDNCEFSLVETFAGGPGVHWTNAVTEIFTGRDCRIDYNRFQKSGDQGLLISTLSTRLERGSKFVSHAVTIGGRLTRNDLNVALAGEHSDATLNGLAILNKDQHCDNHTLLDHAAANCSSHELYKHVLDGQSSCVFKGQILVRPDSQKTDSKQTSKSLLLSDQANMNSQPALEIYADDVKCTHGSTTGPVDEEMVFYLRTRGVGLESARHLLTYAFAADVTRRIRVEPVRQRIEDHLASQHGLPRDVRITNLGGHDEKAR
jgi:Fe-S cluster assembly protein SufD